MDLMLETADGAPITAADLQTEKVVLQMGQNVLALTERGVTFKGDADQAARMFFAALARENVNAMRTGPNRL
ncbi:hypothetical protein [Mameliella sediminis]|uniref:hypothetical protein n=1 Tax=Mameliella sediminis TaxID=2836866 RepID=UPI001C4906FA|nr:hypothetical protein [Mameliella sediminis]MBV7393086.1 hypothetical protein [Mameliella sediminis]